MSVATPPRTAQEILVPWKRSRLKFSAPVLPVDVPVDVDIDVVVDGAVDSSATFDVDDRGGAQVHGAVNVNGHVNVDALVDG